MILNFYGPTTVNIYSSSAPTAGEAASGASEEVTQNLGGDLRKMAYRVDIAPEMTAALRPREDVGGRTTEVLRPREDVGGREADTLRPREDVGGKAKNMLRPREDVGG